MHSKPRNNSKQKLCSAVCLLLMLSQVGACSSSKSSRNVVDVQIASQLQVGTSLADAQSRLGSEGEFGFLTTTDRGETLGLKYLIRAPAALMYLVFEDRTLKSIVHVPRREQASRRRKNETPVGYVVPRNPNTVLDEIWKSQSYMGQDLVDLLESIRASRGKPRGMPEIIPNNLLPAILACALCPGILVVAIAEELDQPRVRRDRELARRQWEYHKIELGMKRREVELIFGKPSLDQTVGRTRGCVYGDIRRGTEIAVEYYDDQVRSIFGEQFSPFDWTGELRKAVLDKCRPESSSAN